MNMRRAILFILGGIFLAAITWAGYWGLQNLVGPVVAEVRPVTPGHQEVAWIYPATSGDNWERLVAGLKSMEKDWQEGFGQLPALRISFRDAFLEQTAAVPQIGLHFEGHEDAKLWIRWYKLSSEADHRVWLEKLQKRNQPPLAIIGGDTSDRALEIARCLEKIQQQWTGSPPLFLITTATADRYYPGEIQSGDPLTQENWPKLMQVYKDRTFRFCFTNSRMAEAVLDFVLENPQVLPEYRCDPFTLAAVTIQDHPLRTLGLVAAAGHLRPAFLYTVAWADDRYSQDLADRFSKVFVDTFYRGDSSVAGSHFLNNYVDYSVGDYYQPNPSEQQVVGIYLNDTPWFRDQHQLLAVPTGTHRARRFLRTLCRHAPKETRFVLAITGDAITFNQVYRDRELAWNILDMPIPLIFFSHRNPVDETAGFGQPLQSTGRINTTGTQDLLLLRDIIEAVVQAGWRDERWLTDSSLFRGNLEQTRWYQSKISHPMIQPEAKKGLPLFDKEGNRRPQRGEHVVWLQPFRGQGRIQPRALISVWSVDPQSSVTTWKMVREPLQVNYNQASEAVGKVHGGE
jgi:hypothetical protein